MKFVYCFGVGKLAHEVCPRILNTSLLYIADTCEYISIVCVCVCVCVYIYIFFFGGGEVRGSAVG